MRTLIVEDEPLAAERLTVLLQQLRPSAVVAAVTDSISESIQWLNENPSPDLILMDIQLSDGPSFEIFRTIKSQCPIILTTAFDSYAMDAFKLLSVDYLLKPVTKSALKQALDKLDMLSGKIRSFPRPINHVSWPGLVVAVSLWIPPISLISLPTIKLYI